MKKYIFFIFLFFTYFSYGQIFYDLKVNIHSQKGELKATAHIYSEKTEKIKVDLKNLDVYAIVYGNEKLSPDKKVLQIEISREKDLLILYKKNFLDFTSENIITDEAVSLIGGWYPTIDKLAVYSLEAEVPKGFILISEYENLHIKQKGNKVVYKFSFPYPTENIHLIGSTEYVKSSENFDGIQIETYLFKRDKNLSQEYLQKAKEYISFYSNLIDKYPYKRFAIVENFFPTGYSMPTFTLIGQQIIKFPFIIEKSLAHEILHQWFGCSVYTKGGNWAEGLTTFLSDYRLSQNKKQYRKNVILKFIPFSGEDYPLNSFYEKTDLKSEAIGYGKSMMVFQMLSDLVGEEDFNKGLSKFYKSFKFKRASWKDIENIFSSVYKQNLNWFFDQWIYKSGLPDIKILKIDHFLKDDGFHIKLTIELNKPYKLKIPIFIKTYLGNIKKYIWTDQKNNEIEIVVKDEPLNILIDPEYRIFRNLSWKEINPVLYSLLSKKDIVIYAPKNSLNYVPITKYFSSGKLFYPQDFSYSQIYNKSVIILGADNPVLQKIFGKKFPKKNYIDLYKNPFGDKNVIAVFNSSSINESKLMIRKIRHYGSYSKLVFENEKVIKKEVKDYQDGIKFQIRQKAEIVSKNGMKSFKDIINDVLKKQIIYIGEQHILFSDHAMQLNIIKAIYKNFPKVAVGMEMFQRSKQKILDQFIQGKIDEKEFLKKSDYYSNWRFNYHLYRPILLYCRENRIPVIALNIDRKIIDKISKNGLESLTKQEKKKLPSEVDFSNVKYIDFLKYIFSQHKSKRNFTNFLQSQIIWDETMAETVSEYIKKNPDKKIIVIAGSGHIRFRFGIPSRVERRTGKSGLSIVLDDQLREDIADYVVYTANLEGEKEKKIGVIVEETAKGLKVEKVSKNSPGEKAGIKSGDIIIAFNEKPVKTVADLKVELYFALKDNVITVLRDGKKINLKINFK